MAKNDNLHKAKDAKNDEFYTRIEDVAEELRHYKKHFEGKVVLCNCDDPKKAGIIPFILSDRTWRDEKHLSLRAFTESQKLRAYERQGHKCPLCVANGINTEYAFEDMEGDHIIPWSKGGHTTDDNLQMLCKKCNAAKADK